MRPFVPIAPLFVGLALACGGATEVVVDAPGTLDEVQAQHAPPGTVVTVERKTRHAGGGACGHSPLCLILVPVLIFDAIFPETWDEATITEGGALTYTGTFDTDGELLQARARDADGWIDLRRLDLASLGRTYVVAVGRAPALADGSAGESVPVTVQSQIDLVGAYRDALDDAGEGRRGDLLVEVLAWLGDEAVPLLVERLPTETGRVQSEVFAAACRPSPPAPQARALVDAVPAPGTDALATSATCLLALDPPETARAIERLATLVDRACAGEDGAMPALSEWTAPSYEVGATLETAVSARIAACASPARRGELRIELGGALTPVEIEALLVAEEGRTYAVLERTELSDPAHRAAVFAALTTAQGTEMILTRLYEADVVPTAAEVDTLGARLTIPSEGWAAHAVKERALAFGLVLRSPDKARLVPVLEGALAAGGKGAKERDSYDWHAFLAGLGRPGHVCAAAPGLYVDDQPMDDVPDIYSSGGLVRFALATAGLTPPELLRLYQATNQDTLATDALCVAGR
ncbi:MAG: hypothetical protein V4850_26980 [Myxococcota bacterium]